MSEPRADVEARIKKPMTDADLEKYTGVKSEDIIKYSDLKNYPKIEDLLPDQKDFRIVLIEDKYNSGHWVVVLRDGKNIEYFNSYGAKWDYDWKFINRMIRTILGQNTNEMTRLMDQAKKDGFKVSYNKNRFQTLSSGSQTCGRWVIFRIETHKMGYNTAEFKDLVEKFKKENDKEFGGSISNDFVVAKYVRG
jgi:hypothetical protein